MKTEAMLSPDARLVPSPVNWRELHAVTVFTLTYLVAATVMAFLRGNSEFLLYIGVMLFLIGVVWTVHRRIVLTRSALWALSVWGLAHMAGGLVTVPESWPVNTDSRVLYNLWVVPQQLKYDHVVHAYGFGVTTWVCWQGLRAAIAHRTGVDAVRPTPGLLLLVTAAGIGFGALNEVVEFAATLLMPETNVGGYRNTGWDLVANFFGASVTAMLIGVHGAWTLGRASERRSGGST